MNIEIRDLFDQTSGCSGCIQLVAAQYATVCNAEILHQFLFSVMRNQCNIHVIPPK